MVLNVFEILCKTGSIELGGRYEIYPNTFAPLRVNFQKLLGEPRAFDIITDFLADKVREADPHRIIGAFTSGISLATAVSIKTNMPMAFVRREPKHFGNREIIIGEAKKGERVVIVDDVFTTVKNNEEYIVNLKKEGVEITHFIVIFDYNMISKDALKEEGIELVSLLSAKEMLNKFERRGTISKEHKHDLLARLKRPYSYFVFNE